MKDEKRHEQTEIIIENKLDLRIDKLLSDIFPELSRSRLQKMIDENCVFCNDAKITKKFIPKTGDRIKIIYPQLRDPENIEIQDLNLDIVYEDDDLLVVNKPKGMVVHPAVGNYNGTLVNGLLHHCKGNLSGINGVIRPGIVHRIDKNTSGLLIVAKNDKSHNYLAQQIKEHSFTREYMAIIYGYLRNDEIIIDSPMGRSTKDRKKMAVTNKNSKSALTICKVMKKYNGFSLVKCILKTGRTHQIRVHLASIGHPLAGDDVYGPKNVISELRGQCLHAYKIGFVHPTTNEYLEFTSPLPKYFSDFIEKIDDDSHK